MQILDHLDLKILSIHYLLCVSREHSIPFACSCGVITNQIRMHEILSVYEILKQNRCDVW